MKQFDVLIKTKNGPEWVCGLFQNSKAEAAAAFDEEVIRVVEWNIVGGAWVEV